mmetsp:Transcript_106463/g.288768  ORF Transcript_106463/g.288768 Transcript_106463/m.288768 type:complete len:230 (-) Transcript_106463:68-757(-)
MVRLIGLTGPIACGKSAVASCLAASGCPVVDADLIAHSVLADRGGQVHQRVVAAFGPGVLGDDGAIDRAKVGAIVFEDHAKLKVLNGITHGPILREILWQTASLAWRGHPRIVLDVPLLVKFPWLRRLFLSTVLVVVARPEVQLERLMKRNSLTEEQARQKVASQAPACEQRRVATFVVENDGSLEELRASVAAFLGREPAGWSLARCTGACAACAAPVVALALGASAL